MSRNPLSRNFGHVLTINQLPIGQVFSVENPQQCIAEDVGIVPVVVPPLQLFQIAVQVLHAHLVESADDGPLEEAPHALDAVGVHVPDHPLFLGVLYGLVPGVLVRDAQVEPQLVGVDGLGFVLDGAPDEVMQGSAPDVRDALNADVTRALDSTGHPGLSGPVSGSYSLPAAAYQGFIDFHDAYQGRPFKGIITHRLADAVTKIPGGLIRNSQGAVNLMGRDALLGDTHQVGPEPEFASWAAIWRSGFPEALESRARNSRRRL